MLKEDIVNGILSCQIKDKMIRKNDKIALLKISTSLESFLIKIEIQAMS